MHACLHACIIRSFSAHYDLAMSGTLVVWPIVEQIWWEMICRGDKQGYSSAAAPSFSQA